MRKVNSAKRHQTSQLKKMKRIVTYEHNNSKLMLFFLLLAAIIIYISNFVNCDCSWKLLPRCKTPRKTYRPKTNGCGPQQQLLSGLLNVVTSSVSREFVECCNQHDRCYGQCGVSKSDCDKQFRACMINKCYLDLACRLKAFSLFNAVSRPNPWSCRAYIGGQIAACDCSSQPTTNNQTPQEEQPISLPEPSVKLYRLKIN